SPPDAPGGRGGGDLVGTGACRPGALAAVVCDWAREGQLCRDRRSARLPRCARNDRCRPWSAWSAPERALRARGAGGRLPIVLRLTSGFFPGVSALASTGLETAMYTKSDRSGHADLVYIASAENARSIWRRHAELLHLAPADGAGAGCALH